VDVAMGIAADGEPIPLHPQSADDFAAFGAVGDGAEEERHRATSRKRR
jgi:hypothetical protein